MKPIKLSAPIETELRTLVFASPLSRSTLREPAKYRCALTIAAALVVAMAFLLTVFPLSYPASFSAGWDVIWRNFTLKQISGYTLLATGALLAVIGLRKRLCCFSVGEYDTWRLLHAVLGVVALVGVLVHTGGRCGDGLTFVLSLTWLTALLTGSTLALLIATIHTIPASRREVFRKAVHGLHVLALWPLPVLLAYHIAGAYLWH